MSQGVLSVCTCATKSAAIKKKTKDVQENDFWTTWQSVR